MSTLRTGVLLALGGLLAALAVVPLAVADAPSVKSLPLRVHIVKASVPALDAASVIDAAGVRERVAEINKIFAPAGIAFAVESVAVEQAADEQPFRDVAGGAGKAAPALRAVVNKPAMLAPSGWDLYVVRDLAPVRLGGAWLCAAGGESGQGAAFVAAQTPNGRPLPIRKWAHELGHSLGLMHTPCSSEFSSRLMMSGNCALASTDRAEIVSAEVQRMQPHLSAGRPAPCARGQNPDEHD